MITMTRLQFTCILLTSAALCLCTNASDWLQFRGANGAGIAAPDAAPVTEWSESKNLKWKTALPGPGSSCPIVLGERVYVTCYSGYGDGTAGGGSAETLKRHLVCLEKKTGAIVWDKAVAAELPEDPYLGGLTEHGYASSTPATDGERIYVFYGKTGALAFDLNGNQLWKVNLGKQSSNRRWGSCASPIVYKNTVIVNAAEEARTLFALDKMTGKELWKVEARNLELCYATPAIVEAADGKTDLVLALPGEMWGLDIETGKRRWFVTTGITGNVSPTVVASNGIVFATGGYPRQGSIAVRAGGDGDVTATAIVWTSQDASYGPSPVVNGEHLYFINEQGSAMCMETKTGKLIFKERLPGMQAGGGNREGGPGGAGGPPPRPGPGGGGSGGGPGGRGPGRGGSKPFYGSPVLVNGKIYVSSRRNGAFILEAKPEFKVLAQNKIAGDDSDFNATPAVVGSQIFLRSNKMMYCIEGN